MKNHWEVSEEQGSCGFPSKDLFDEDGFITPWLLVEATNKWFKTEYTQQDALDTVPCTVIRKWDGCLQGWFAMQIVTREDALAWVMSHENRITWLRRSGFIPRT